jgi:hypothetical protein
LFEQRIACGTGVSAIPGFAKLFWTDFSVLNFASSDGVSSEVRMVWDGHGFLHFITQTSGWLCSLQI